ncbi:MAG: hypothetical protein HY731_12080, partial [Candidatus Tectomicrobia bacterium]|nr:hypothetical protein [Candidatus Tectomicrobia bacterium]
MKSKWVRGIFFLPLFLCVMFAIARAEEGGRTISSIEIRGNRKIETSTIRFYIRSREGEEYSPSKIREDIKNIYTLGFFRDIQVEVEPEGVARIKIRFLVDEEPSIREVRITGNKEVSTDDIRGKVTLKPLDVLNRQKLQESVRNIKLLYEQKGFYLARITPNLEEIEPD